MHKRIKFYQILNYKDDEVVACEADRKSSGLNIPQSALKASIKALT